MDAARCLCAKTSTGVHLWSPDCPIHGLNANVPKVPWLLSFNDKRMLHALRIDPEDSAEIQRIRQADEDRWRYD